MTESLPEAELLATRSAVEAWLAGGDGSPGGFGDLPADNGVLAANNLTLWARAFLRVTAGESAACEEALKRQGALEFARRVLKVTAVTLVATGACDPSTLGTAFVSELALLEAGG